MDNSFENKIESLDKYDMLGVIDTQPNQLRLNYADSMRDDIGKQDGMGINNIIVVGMGGSALAGDIIKNWLHNRLLVPLEIIRGNILPSYANEHTLVLVSSYSGNTKETLQALDNAIKYNVRIIGIGNGGELQNKCESKNITYFNLPKVSQPRLAVFSCIKAIACILEDMELVNGDLRRELLDTADFLDTQKLAWGKDSEMNNKAKDIASRLAGSPTLVYPSYEMRSVGYKIKISINENAKQMAFSDNFSELNHNEIEGWQAINNSNFKALIIKSSFESDEVNSRINKTKKILEKQEFEILEIIGGGSNLIQQILFCILLGDFISAYMAIINGQDPTKVELIEGLKKDL